MTKILYIEDDPINKFLVKKVLSSSGFEVFEASNGEEGIKMAENVMPNLILMDMQMPGLDGYEATRRIRKNETMNGLPIIALTAHALPGDKEKCLAAGCDGFIAKPIDVKNFVSQISAFIK